MATQISALCYDEGKQQYEIHEKLSNLLTQRYNDQNIIVEFLEGDRVHIEGGYNNINEDNYIYEINKRGHWFDKYGRHGLTLWMSVIQDMNDSFYM